MAAAASGDLGSVQTLLKHHEVPLDQVLAKAVRHNHVNIIKWCIESGAKITCPVILAVPNYPHFEVFELLITSGLDINLDLDRMCTFLILEVMHKNFERVSFCLENGANPNLGSYAHIWSALAVAAQYGASIEIVDLLLKMAPSLTKVTRYPPLRRTDGQTW